MVRKCLGLIMIVGMLLALSSVSVSAAPKHQGDHDQQGQHDDQDGHGDQDGQGDSQDYGPFHSTSPDSGTCGNDWANDSFDRVFTVSGNHVVERFEHGSFVTFVGPSPGACETSKTLPGNGHIIAPGVTGRMGGVFDVVVTGGSPNPNAHCTAATCGTTAGFIATVYGPGATYTIPTYYFVYHANAGISRTWINASADRGGDHGDIYTI